MAVELTRREPLEIELFRDLGNIFQGRSAQRLPTHEIVTALIHLKQSPWCDWNNGSPITKRQAGRLLSVCGVRSKVIRHGRGEVSRGFTIEDVALGI